MLLTPVINQLAANLPLYTNLFSDQVNVTSLTRVGTVATAVTDVDHGFSVGQFVTISGAVELVPIINLTFDALTGYATAETALNNNLTENYDYKTNLPSSISPVQVQVDGALEVEYNGTFNLISVPNRNTFTYQLSGTPASPATGSPVLYSYAYNYYRGLKQITSIPDSTSFTFDISDNASLTTTGEILAHSNVRISGAATDERALNAYTEQGVNKYWLFVTSGDSVTSKNRNILNDSINQYKSGSAVEYRLRLVDNLGVIIFAPTKDEIGGKLAYDTINGEVQVAIFKSMLNFPVAAQYAAASNFSYTYLEGSLLEYDQHPAYLAYKMLYGVQFDVTYYDTYISNDRAPFLDIDMSLNINGGDLGIDIDLDEEPIT